MATNNAANIPTAAAGKVLQGAGVGAASTFSTPTYPSASGSSRTILVSDGTNNVYSTETWAVPGASGNVLTSDGTNWTSAAPASGSSYVIAFTSGASSAAQPADATVYYLSNVLATWSTSNTVQTRLYIPVAGTITKAYGSFSVGSLGSAETTTINIRLNGTTNTSIATVAFNASPANFSNTGLSVSVSAGDYIALYLDAQTYATNPNTITFSVTLLIS